MLNICIVFAQLERETIQKRVQDAYYSRNKRGCELAGRETMPVIVRDLDDNAATIIMVE